MTQANHKMPKDFDVPITKKINKLVLTEDDEGYAVLLQRLFERASIKCELIWFPHGIDLLKNINETTPSDDTLLLLDLNLPVMSGFEVLAELRQKFNKDALPIIVISTTIREKEYQQCLELGANSFLKKPISYEELTSTMKRIGMEF
jgi:DNA-binding response OmpR family regulator